MEMKPLNQTLAIQVKATPITPFRCSGTLFKNDPNQSWPGIIYYAYLDRLPGEEASDWWHFGLCYRSYTEGPDQSLAAR